MKKEWTKQSYEKFILYFKTAMPTVYDWRFHRKKVKMFLSHGNSKTMSFVFKGAAKFAKANTKGGLNSKDTDDIENV